MSVHIQFDNPKTVYTNLDNISGRVILQLTKEENLNGVVVKLECESTTRLSSTREDDARLRRSGRPERGEGVAMTEIHKLLYFQQTVFPPSVNGAPPGRGSVFAMPPGHHVWPFSFKIPFNNACQPLSFAMGGFNFSKLEVGPDTNRHLKRPLPPTLSGFPGVADIIYYVKVTCQRAAFYKENYRAAVPFKFMPIEPVRSPPTRRELYARRTWQFAQPAPTSQQDTKSGFFGRKPVPVPQSPSTTPAAVTVDARIPEPAILTCHEPIKARVLIRKDSDSSDEVYLDSLQIVLLGYTHVQAQELLRFEQTPWVIVTRQNLDKGLNMATLERGKEVELDSSLWSNVSLPPSIAPSFETCNISRTYELDIIVGLRYGSARNARPDTALLPLKQKVQVYSGIPPPQALLDKMNAKPDTSRPPQTPSTPAYRPPVPSRPLSTSHPAQQPQSPVPMHDGMLSPGAAESYPDEPPPSYDDVMAENLPPSDAPRREYQVPNSAPVIPDRDRKG